MKCDDELWLTDELSRWWKLPTMKQTEYFIERVGIMVDSGIDENEARKIALDLMIFK